MSRTDNDEITRVSIFTPNLGGGGAERVLLLLASGLVERNFETTIVAGKAEGLFSSSVPEGVRVVDLGKPHMSRCILSLAKHLKTQKPDVLVSAQDHANIAALLAVKLSRNVCRVIPTVHITHSIQHARGKGMREWLLRNLIRLCYPWADAIVAVSKGTADDMAEFSGVPRELIRVIYNPVISSSIEKLAREPVDHPWFAPDQPDVILAIGRLYPQKDYPTLLRAFAILRKKRDVRLLILGEGTERSTLESMVVELGLTDCVSLPGFAKNPFAYMARASLLAMSSAWEALPTVLIEALALGTRIVSTNCACGPNEILKGGEYGRLVPVGDPTALSDAMNGALSQPPPTIPEGALLPYTIDVATSEYVSLIEEVVNA